MNSKWYFTFGVDNPLSSRYVMFEGTADETRAMMIQRFGLDWAAQYREEDFPRVLAKHVKKQLTPQDDLWPKQPAQLDEEVAAWVHTVLLESKIT